MQEGYLACDLSACFSKLNSQARLGEIERLQEARDAVRLELLKVKKNGGSWAVGRSREDFEAAKGSEGRDSGVALGSQ